MRRKLRLGVVLTSLIAFVAGAAIAHGEVFQTGNLKLTADGGVKPKRLPKKKMAPIKLLAEGHVTTLNGETPPIADKVVVDFDKNGKYYNKGFPSCKPKKLIDRRTAAAKKACKKALIGKGRTNGIIDFPDQDPFEAAGPLLVFNGPNKGKHKKTVVFHVFANVPAPTAFVVPATLTPLKGGKFGTRVTTFIPEISGGNGTLTDFNVKIGKKYKIVKKKKNGKKVKKKKSILNARCKNKRFVAQFEVTWRDGSKLNGGITRPCKQKRG
jgi:hypothetical protein